MMLTSNKLLNQVAALEAELTALRTALEEEARRARASEQALEEARMTIETLAGAQQDLQARLQRVEEKPATEWPDLGPIERRIGSLEDNIIRRNRVLKLEKQVAQQAEDVQAAVAGLIARIDNKKRARKST